MLKLRQEITLEDLKKHPKDNPEMVLVEGGTFKMGGEDWFDRAKPIHAVKLDDFYLYRYPVSLALWVEVMGNYPEKAYSQDLSRPVERVSWDDAQLFLQKLNELTGYSYGSPTEAQWEYAARGGRYRQSEISREEDYPYAGSHELAEVAWGDHNSFGETHPLGLLRPNELGLYGMSGNLREWCQDWYGSEYYEVCAGKGLVVDPKGPPNGSFRVLRGGSWDLHDFDYFRVSSRDYNQPYDRNVNFGFRFCWYRPA
ncbi:MAG: formylglycine-generating enzyme family protein [Bacteroidia bacterium]|nr:formylglycine-generating enzyme family protein [Bacteroidia bacterium]